MAKTESLSSYVPYSMLLREDIVINKDGSLMTTFKICPNDLSFESAQDIQDIMNRFNQLFLRLEGYTVWLDTYRRKINITEANKNIPSLAEFNERLYLCIEENYYNEYYFTIQYIPPKNVTQIMAKRATYRNTTTNLESIAYDFIEKQEEIETILKAIFRTAIIIKAGELLTYLYNTYNERCSTTFIPPQCSYLDEYLSATHIRFSNPVIVGDTARMYITLYELPFMTELKTILRLMRQKVSMRYTIRAIILRKQEAIEIIKRKREHHSAKEKGFREIVQDSTGGDGMANPGQTVRVEEANEALREIEQGETFSITTITIEIEGTHTQKMINISKKIKAIFNQDGYIMKEEKLNAPSCFLAEIIGNVGYNQRKPIISNQNIGTLIPISEASTGTYSNNHLKSITGTETPHLILRTAGQKNYYLNLNNQDIGHTFVAGPTGSGKSFLLCILAIQWLQYITEKNHSKIVYLDVDNSAKNATLNFDGQHYDIGGKEQDTIRFNPFQDITKEKIEWMEKTLKIYFQKVGIHMDTNKEKVLHKTLSSLCARRNLTMTWETITNNIQDEEMKNALKLFKEKYGDLFTDEKEPDIYASWTTFEIRKLLEKDPNIIEFLMSYIFYKINTTLDYHHPTLLIIDEGWLFLKNPNHAQEIIDWIKTLRKKSCYVVLATQSIADIRKSPIFPVIVNNCLTKIMLPNNAATEENNVQNYTALGLNAQEILALKELLAKRDMLIKKVDHSQQVSLIADNPVLEYIKNLREERIPMQVPAQEKIEI